MRMALYTLFMTFAALPSQASVTRLQAFPTQVFAKEDGPVIFTAQTDTKAPRPKSVSLYQVDDQGRRLRFIGALSDDKMLGDKVRGDGVYTRKIELNGAKSGKLHFAVIENEAGDSKLGDAPALPPQADIEVLRRPTLPEVLKKIWARIQLRDSAVQ